MPDSKARKNRLSSIVATPIVLVVAVVGSLTMGLLATLVGFIPPRGNHAFSIARWWGKLMLLAGWVKVECRFETTLDPAASYIILPNHQSYYDIPALLSKLPTQTRFAAKRSLFRLPVFGWALYAAGFVAIDRGDRSRASRAFSTAADRLRQGVSMLFFPEGSRSYDGKIQEFERGGFLLAIKSGLPIVPVGIEGAIDVMRRGSLRTTPGTIRLAFGAPIDPAEYGVRRRAELMTEVRDRIEALRASLR